MPMEGEDAIVKLDEMFREYLLGAEYEEAWAAFKTDWERVCRDNREMRDQLREMKRSGNGSAA